jgi:hypothetical protein
MATQKKIATPWVAPALAAVGVLVFAAIVAASGLTVTAGGRDQRLFHFVTVMQFRNEFPYIDVSNVQTATAPLYHLIVAAISGPLHLSEAGTQVVAALFAAALAAAVVWFVSAVANGWLRVIVAAPVLLSAYFWESALWMLNDVATLLFAFLAFVVVLRHTAGTRSQVLVGVLLAAAVATRQTYVWALVPVVAVVLLDARTRPVASRLAAVARVAVPPLLVLVALVAVWKGFVPPPFREINAATRSWVSLSFCAAVAGLFLGPVLLATARPLSAPPRLAALVAAVTAAPAVIFPSVATVSPDDARRGGLVWGLVAHGPSVLDRSLVLVVLAALGGWIACHVVATLPRPVAVLLATSLVALSVVLWAGLQLHQKYFELPIAALTVIALCALISSGRLVRQWPLVALAAAQFVLTAGIVVKPVLSALVA